MNDNGNGVLEGLLFRCFARESTTGPQEELSLAVNPLKHTLWYLLAVLCVFITSTCFTACCSSGDSPSFSRYVE